ncbi:MAG: glucosamine-6-phosphate deaminase, partial [Cyanobacteria bacterium J06641_5]
MEIVICPDRSSGTKVAAAIVARYLQREQPVLGLATGGTPESLYRLLVERYQQGKLSFRHCITFNLDEYVGLAPTHPQSYYHYMRQHLGDRVDLDPSKMHIPPGTPTDPTALRQICHDYESKIAATGGIQLQILGIGANGHIGFNEPMSSLASRTGLRVLSRQTRADNARFFDRSESVPRHAISMGIGTILEAEHCLLLAFGTKKAKAIAAAIEGPVSARCPASALQMHPQVTIVLDEAAATLLEYRQDYDWAAANA